ncbi:hypothetical protein HDU98_010631 [Podochytrium sp. JEL0797]|nr:hypothetical protein HDU98_010631 [Podochytrium sp. JEL0797]
MPGEWHAVPMHSAAGRDSDSPGAIPVLFSATLRIPLDNSSFEYTLRLVAFSNELVHFKEPHHVAAVNVVGGTPKLPKPSILAWLNTHPHQNAKVQVENTFETSPTLDSLFKILNPSVSLETILTDQHPTITVAGSINSSSLENVLLQLNPASPTTFTLERRNQHWLQPGHGRSGWPDSSLSTEVSLAGWSIQPLLLDSNDKSRPLFVILLPTPPHVLQCKPNGQFAIVPTFSAHLWPHEYKLNPVRAFVAVSTDPVEAVRFLIGWIRKTVPAPGSGVHENGLNVDLGGGMDLSRENASGSVREEEEHVPAKDPSSIVNDFKTEASLSNSKFYDYLGWCTWNSFYRNVSESGIVAGLEEFNHHGIPVRWLLVDDGWQNVDSELKLESFGLNDKFPTGLPLFHSLKNHYNLTHIAVWHTLIGYWNGIAPSSPLGAKYPLRQITRTNGSSIHVIDPSAYAQYYADFHKQLTDAGIDFFKVDDQSAFEASRDENAPGEVLRVAQGVVLKENEKGRHVVWCMGHNVEVFYQVLLFGDGVRDDGVKRSMRSSDDFFPDDPDSHTWHILSNAFNSLLISNLSPHSTLMDWDMFQSSHAYSQFHAIARALSNGPVYLSDAMGRHDEAVVAPLVVSNGRVVRVDGGETCLPVSKCLLKDLRGGEGLLFVEADAGGSGCAVVGVFNCARGGVKQPVVDMLGVVGELRGGMRRRNSGMLCVRSFRTGKVEVVGDEESARVVCVLGEGEADVVTVCPMWKSGGGVLVGCVGIVDKYYGAAGVQGVEFEDTREGGVKVRLDAKFEGKYGFVVTGGNGEVEIHVVDCGEGVKKWYL